MFGNELALTGMCLAAALLLLPGCESLGGGAGVSVGSSGGQSHSGPPDHAPAHGYRKKHDRHDVELVYDAGLGVYAVAEYAGYYFHGDVFYRLDDGAWHISANIDGPWNPAPEYRIPPGLEKHGKSKNKNQGKGKGRGRS